MHVAASIYAVNGGSSSGRLGMQKRRYESAAKCVETILLLRHTVCEEISDSIARLDISLKGQASTFS